MFCRTKKVEKLFDALKDEIKELREEVREARKEYTIPYGEWPQQVIDMISYYPTRKRISAREVVEQILEHLGMEIVEEYASVSVQKKPKVKKTT